MPKTGVLMDASKARVLSTVVKTMADEKTAAEKKSKGKGAATKPVIKNISKSNAASTKANKDLYDDYVADEYDDYADHFIQSDIKAPHILTASSRMADEASSSGEMRRNLRSHSANRVQHETENFETSYDNIDIMQWEDDDIAT
ncbi:hypothetical protein X798_07071 [Onchocerca flexuosa]|uniref:Uncharacterized protein n=1 Tax=Onchocerca flexuosa TaxID=387005 RepID=A0A238BL67_9BILA|nr:hypothetical protein X798_07071 [Onchocerca flexuosa]